MQQSLGPMCWSDPDSIKMCVKPIYRVNAGVLRRLCYRCHEFNRGCKQHKVDRKCLLGLGRDLAWDNIASCVQTGHSGTQNYLTQSTTAQLGYSSSACSRITATNALSRTSDPDAALQSLILDSHKRKDSPNQFATSCLSPPEWSKAEFGPSIAACHPSACASYSHLNSVTSEVPDVDLTSGVDTWVHHVVPKLTLRENTSSAPPVRGV